MPRPDQAKFDVFARPFEKIDEQLAALSKAHRFQVVKNLNRQPCRVLQRTGNPHCLLDISYDDYWVETEFRDDLPQSVTLIAYYTPLENEQFVWKMMTALAAHIPFSEIQTKLHSYVEEAALTIDSWTPERILETGERLANPARKYGPQSDN